MNGLACRTGVVYPVLADPAGLPGFAVRVEELGFDTLWVIEDCFLSGGLTMAATALAVTESIGVGVGLLPIPLRNPAIMAMEIATLSRMHPGRFTATLGHGVAEWMQQIGALPTHRLAALSETAAAIRKLLAGETVSVIGTHVKLSQVALEQAPQVAPPVLIGTTGPKGLALAGEYADGILLPEGCGPAFVEWAGRPDVGDLEPQVCRLQLVQYPRRPCSCSRPRDAGNRPLARAGSLSTSKARRWGRRSPAAGRPRAAGTSGYDQHLRGSREVRRGGAAAGRCRSRHGRARHRRRRTRTAARTFRPRGHAPTDRSMTRALKKVVGRHRKGRRISD